MTTKLRHPHVASLRPTVTKTNLTGRNCNSAKRKSAVQMLQETKAFYVKSETVLDKKQEFKPSRVSDFAAAAAYVSFGQADDKENNLQNKLRLLLDFDSIESRNVSRNGQHVGNFHARRRCHPNSGCVQHKSLPDLHLSPSYSSADSSESSFGVKCDGDSRSAYSTFTQADRRGILSEEAIGCKHCVKSANACTSPNEFQTHSRLYTSFRVVKSGESGSSRAAANEASNCRRRSNTSSCNRSRHNSSSKHSQSADSGRQSQGGSIGLRTGRSGLPEFPSPPPKTVWSDSGTEDDFPPLFRNDRTTADRKRPILRSKSDISYKYCANKAKPLSSSFAIRPPLPFTEELETFFDHLGMNPVDYKELASNNSGNSTPVYFSSVSSLDSCVDLTVWNVPEPCKTAECPSIVERNARIIKWLYNCRKYQKNASAEGNSGMALLPARET